MLYIIGTSHIAKESLEKVREKIESLKPDCVAVELDYNRYLAMKEKKKGKVNLPFFQKIIFKALQKLQDKLSEETGITPGQEMMDAVEYGLSVNADVIFIDKNLEVTIAKLMSSLSVKEKIKLLAYTVSGFFGIGIGLDSKEIDLNKIPAEEFIQKGMAELKNKFPKLHKLLVEERDEHMARMLIALNEEYKTIVAVVGAAHVKGIEEIIKNHVLNEKLYYT